MTKPGLSIPTKVVPYPDGRFGVEWKNPNTGDWDVVSSWSTVEGAKDAVAFFNSQGFAGWTSAKISKSKP